jgi:hypothetical protein
MNDRLPVLHSASCKRPKHALCRSSCLPTKARGLTEPLATRHRDAHGWFARHIPGADAHRQRALDSEAAHLEQQFDRLSRGHRGHEKAIAKVAATEAKANMAAIKDWVWSPAVDAARRRLAALDRVADELAAGSPEVQAAAAGGGLAAAIAVTDRAQLVRRSNASVVLNEATTDIRTVALRTLLSAEERAAADPTALAADRRTTALALAGDQSTIQAAARCDTQSATIAAEAWTARQDQASSRKNVSCKLPAITGIGAIRREAFERA